MKENAVMTELLDLTAPFTGRADQVQGPGGNTSVKTPEGIMFIKASGFRFEELNETSGISSVDSIPVADYFRKVIPTDKASDEKRMLDIIAASVRNKEDGMPYPKPSMETGFHAVLGKYVIHTHSVWANLINCSAERAALLKELSGKLGISVADIPFVSPGFGLSHMVTQALYGNPVNAAEPPEVFMLAGHGIIAHGDAAARVRHVLDRVDDAARDIFGLDDSYPDTRVQGGGTEWIPVSGYVRQIIHKHGFDLQSFEKVLFPDQTVFFRGQIGFGGEKEKKINISVDGSVTYCCSKREAESVHETLTAWLFIQDTLLASGRKPHFLASEETEYISGMEMEKHRIGIMKDKK